MADPAPTNAQLGATLYGGDNPAPPPVADPAAPPPAAAAPAAPPAADPTAPVADPAKPAEGILTAEPAKDPDAPPATPAPTITVETYKDLALPEGLTVDEPMFNEFKELGAKHQVSPEAAADFLSLQKKFQEAQQSSLTAAMQAQDAAWSKELDAIPEFQGANRKVAQEAIGRMIEEFGSPQVRELLGTYGLANNPVLARWVYSMAQALVESDAVPPGQPTRTAANGRRVGQTLGEILYGSTDNPQ